MNSACRGGLCKVAVAGGGDWQLETDVDKQQRRSTDTNDFMSG
jgi:hypothetical protein